MPVDGFSPCTVDNANWLLEQWGHYLGPCHRPFGIDCWTFDVAGQPVSVAVGASIVSAHLVDDDGNELFRRDQVIELARLCSVERWATRLMLRWWREVGALRWSHWPVEAAVAYSQNNRHAGDIYRWDGWKRVRSNSGSGQGGGTWTKHRDTAHAAVGPKSLWVWRYPVPDLSGTAQSDSA